LSINVAEHLSTAMFTHAGLSTRNRGKACIKVFLYCQGHVIYSLWRR